MRAWTWGLLMATGLALGCGLWAEEISDPPDITLKDGLEARLEFRENESKVRKKYIGKTVRINRLQVNEVRTRRGLLYDEPLVDLTDLQGEAGGAYGHIQCMCDSKSALKANKGDVVTVIGVGSEFSGTTLNLAPCELTQVAGH